MTKAASLLFAGVAYAIFFATFLYLIAFVGNLPLAALTVDRGPEAPVAVAVIIDAVVTLGILAPGTRRGATEIGQGSDDVLAGLVAEALGLVAEVHHDLAGGIDGGRVGGVQEEHRGGGAGIEAFLVQLAVTVLVWLHDCVSCTHRQDRMHAMHQLLAKQQSLERSKRRAHVLKVLPEFNKAIVNQGLG